MAGAGAAGAVCVEAAAGAGVDGAWDGPDGADDAGAALGYSGKEFSAASSFLGGSGGSEHTFDTIHTMNPFSSILYDSMVFAS